MKRGAHCHAPCSDHGSASMGGDTEALEVRVTSSLELSWATGRCSEAGGEGTSDLKAQDLDIQLKLSGSSARVLGRIQGGCCLKHAMGLWCLLL